MRILAVEVAKVGGLPDGRIELPHGPVAAFAGANGTGKSKLLACILAPWTGQVPAPRHEAEMATVLVEMRLSQAERSALESFSRMIGWGEAEVPELVRVGVRRSKLVGNQRFSEPEIAVIAHAWAHSEFLSSQPTLDIIYLPAERRLVEPRGSGIDLNQLSAAIAYQKGAQSREAVNNYGRLDDSEFEDFAKALCVAASLPADPESEEGQALAGGRTTWESFQQTVNSLIAPKEILGLTRAHPEQLRIRTPQGDTHAVRDLSSGERQALIIVSRVLRGTTTAPTVLIDEPDAYLHPNLSRRLELALEEGVGPDGQLVVATHSPAILDGMQPNAILRLEHNGSPRLVADDRERLDLYRDAGFRSSALTQSDLLVVVEGASDVSILTLAIPELGRAAIHAAGGRAQVVRAVEQLTPFDLPVIGVVDRDLARSPLPTHVESHIAVWPAADIEGVYLGSAAALQSMIDHGLVKSEYTRPEDLSVVIARLCAEQRENVLAEIVRADIVSLGGYEWPSPRGLDPLGRLRQAVKELKPVSEDELELAIARAETVWGSAQSDLLSVVRGKYILSAFTSEASEMRSGRALLEATARSRPTIVGMDDLAAMVARYLETAP